MSTNRHDAAEPISNPQLWDLDIARVIQLEDRNHNFELKLRRIASQDWLIYFEGMSFTAEQDGKSRVTTNNWEAARLALAEAVLIDASGYKIEGGARLSSIPDWQKKIPLSHRHRLGQTLTDVRIAQSNEDGFTIYPEGEVVFLDGTYTALEFLDEEGDTRTGMLKVQGLKHVLATPSEEQYRRYARESSRSKVVGGSRTGKTIFQGSQALLARLYDELVISVDGYSFKGVALTTNVQIIVREMDLLHKVVAAAEVFQPQDTSSLAGSDAE